MESRVVVYAPTGKDARLISQVLSRSDITSHVSESSSDLLVQLNNGVGALLLVDEVLAGQFLKSLYQFVHNQAKWSDLPILVLSHKGFDSSEFLEVFQQLGNVTLLERPLEKFTLESAVKAALRARNRQYEMRDIDKRKDEFLAMLAHELRNPLAPVSAASELLKLPNLAPEKIKQMSEIISRQVKHMSELIDDLLDVSRVSRGLVTLDKQVLEAKKIIDNALEQVRPLLEKQRHELTVRISPEVAFVKGDPKRLVQILSNVLNNAVKYTPSSGKIVLSIDVTDSDVIFSVTDNGIGIPSEILSHIFEMFTQAQRTSDRTQGGLGIGLALVKSLVELHNGTIEAYSDGPDKGSRFTITFPRSFDLEEVNTALLTPQEQLDDGHRLLIVDDNVDAATMLGILLESEGYNVEVVHSGNAALEAVATAQQIDACLLDIGLPDMDGNNLAKRLREIPITSSTKLIAITGYGQDADCKKTRKSGFDHHLVKPVDMSKLLDVLSTLK